jgi:ArsR family transcriptional regulator
MQDEDLRLQNLEEHVVDLEKRVAALEGLAPPPLREIPFPGNEARGKRHIAGGGGSESPRDVEGTLSYSAFAQFAQRRVHLKYQQSLAQIFQVAPEVLAQLFAALSSPHRIIILRTLCIGPRSRQQLQELLGMASAGQLYHHLKELQAAGLISGHGGSYSIEMEAVIPICMALMIAAQLALPDQRNPGDREASDQEQAGPESS